MPKVKKCGKNVIERYVCSTLYLNLNEIREIMLKIRQNEVVTYTNGIGPNKCVTELNLENNYILIICLHILFVKQQRNSP